MQLRSISYNFLLNLVNTLAGVLFPLITFPYVSRVLSPADIGVVQFYDSVIQFVVALSALGIPLYAVRHLARIRDDREKMQSFTFEVIILHSIVCLLGYVVLFALCFFSQRINANLSLFLLMSSTLGFSAIGVSWFYEGVEDFKFITIRSLVIRVFGALSLFIFVRSESDLMAYGAISTIAQIAVYLANFIHLRKYVDYKNIDIRQIKILKHIRPIAGVMVLSVLMGVYVQVDVVMLGFLSDNSSVGYYGASLRVINILLAISTALGVVLLPRLSHTLGRSGHEEYKDIVIQSLNFVTMMSLPMVAGLFVLSSDVIQIFAGEKFYPAITTVGLMSPLLFISALTNLIGMQVLYSQGREKIVSICVFTSMLINIVLNFWLIPLFSQNGAALGSEISETFLLVALFGCLRRVMRVDIPWTMVCKTILCSLAMGYVIYCFDKSGLLGFWPPVVAVLFKISIGVLAFILFSVAVRNRYVESFMRRCFDIIFAKMH